MRLRFLAAAGPEPALQGLASKLMHGEELSPAPSFSAGSLRLWTERNTALIENGRRKAAAIGLLFDRASGSRLTSLPDALDMECAMLRGCWGAYVLFRLEGEGHSVLRDPSGSIPVYYGDAGALRLYASDAEMLGRAWPGAFRPNLAAVRNWLTFPFLRTEDSGALGVQELLPGSARIVRAGKAEVRLAWRPSSFAADPVTTDPDEAERLLREEILRTVPRLATGAKSVILRLSGGLDSSIVAAALADGGVPFRAVTFATRSAEGDERGYAREVAVRFGIDLVELSEGDIHLSFRRPGNPFRRPPSPLLQPLRRAFASLGASVPEGLVLDGAGGDNVFAAITSASPALDAFSRQGVAAGCRTLADIARLHGATFWTALRAALRRATRGARARWPADTMFLLPEPGPKAVHPWLDRTPGLLPGSADHVRMILGIQHFLPDPEPGEPPTLHPLIAQPIVELCLAIPSWLWVARGRDRAVARAAFRGIVPDRILDRRGKGSLEGMFMRGYMNKRTELREFLVSGRLAEAGIVDPKALSAYLDQKAAPRDAYYIRILEIASAEQWLRSFDP